jgi:hypothetical protein
MSILLKFSPVISSFASALILLALPISGWVSVDVACSMVVAAAFLLIIVAPYHLRKYMALSSFVLGCVIVAFFAVGAAAAGIMWQKLTSHSVSSDNPHEQLITNPAIEWDGHGQVVFQGKFLRAGEKLAVYVDYTFAGNGDGSNNIVHQAAGKPERVKIGSVDRFVREERLNVTLGTVEKVEGNQQVLGWGDPASRNKVGITWANYVGRVVLIDEAGQEEYYPFAFISRSSDMNPRVPVIVGPKALTSQSNW